jgi:hypothetical protein
MGFETDIRSERPRKTLDDIRRELDQEASEIEQTLAAESRLRASRPEPSLEGEGDRQVVGQDRQSSWLRRFLIVALIGCIVTEVVLIADIVVARYERHVAASRNAPFVAAVEPMRDSDVQAAPSPAAVEPAADAMAVAPVTGPPAAVEPAASGPSASGGAERGAYQDSDKPPVPEPQPVGDMPRVVEPRPEGDTPRRVEPRPAATPSSPSRPAPRPPRTVSPPSQPTMASVPTASPVIGPEDWHRAQGDLRAALKHWLEISSRSDAGAQAAQAVVILGPDGRTAKTEVTESARGRIVVREQRWQLLPTGWTLVYERDVRPGAP